MAKSRSSSRPPSALEVIPWDVGTWLVASETRTNEVHLVDLSYGEPGEEVAACSCEDWMFKNGDWEFGRRKYECKHIAAVRRVTTGFKPTDEGLDIGAELSLKKD